MHYFEGFENPFVFHEGKYLALYGGPTTSLKIAAGKVVMFEPIEDVHLHSVVALNSTKWWKLSHTNSTTWCVHTYDKTHIKHYDSFDSTNTDYVTYSFNTEEKYMAAILSLKNYSVVVKEFCTQQRYTSEVIAEWERLSATHMQN